MFISSKQFTVLLALTSVSLPGFLYATEKETETQQPEKRKYSSLLTTGKNDSTLPQKKRTKKEKECEGLEEPKTGFLTLPNEVIAHIVEYLPGDSFYPLGATCKLLQASIQDCPHEVKDIHQIQSWLDEGIPLFNIGLIISRDKYACEKLYRVFESGGRKFLKDDYGFNIKADDENLSGFFEEWQPYGFALRLAAALGHAQAIEISTGMHKTLENYILVKNLPLNLHFSDYGIPRHRVDLEGLEFRRNIGELIENLGPGESRKAFKRGDYQRVGYWHETQKLEEIPRIIDEYHKIIGLYQQERSECLSRSNTSKSSDSVISESARPKVDLLQHKADTWHLKLLAYLEQKIVKLEQQKQREEQEAKKHSLFGIIGTVEAIQKLAAAQVQLFNVYNTAIDSYTKLKYEAKGKYFKRIYELHKKKLKLLNINATSNDYLSAAFHCKKASFHLKTKNEERELLMEAAQFFEESIKLPTAEMPLEEKYAKISKFYRKKAETLESVEERRDWFVRAEQLLQEAINCSKERNKPYLYLRLATAFIGVAKNASDKKEMQEMYFQKAIAAIEKFINAQENETELYLYPADYEMAAKVYLKAAELSTDEEEKKFLLEKAQMCEHKKAELR